MSLGRHTITLPAATADFLRIAGILLDAGLIVIVDADSAQPASVAAALSAADRVELSVVADATGIALDATGSILTLPAGLQEDQTEQIVETLRRAGRVA